MKSRIDLILVTIFVIICIPLALIRLLWAIITNVDRAWKILLAFDRVGNAALNGDPDESISSRAYRDSHEGKRVFCILCKILDRIQKNHCKNSAGK